MQFIILFNWFETAHKMYTRNVIVFFHIYKNKRSFGKFKHNIFCNNLKLTIFIINKIWVLDFVLVR